MFTRVIDERPRDQAAAVRADLSAQASRRESGGAPLYVSPNTVEPTSRALHRKLGVTPRADAVVLGVLDSIESPG